MLCRFFLVVVVVVVIGVVWVVQLILLLIKIDLISVYKEVVDNNVDFVVVQVDYLVCKEVVFQVCVGLLL